MWSLTLYVISMSEKEGDGWHYVQDLIWFDLFFFIILNIAMLKFKQITTILVIMVFDAATTLKEY